MKKKLRVVSGILLATLVVLAVLIKVSHTKAIQIEDAVLKPCLSTSIHYSRRVQFGAFDPFRSLFPHCTIAYDEIPVNTNSDTPTITVNLFGQIDCQSKEVAELLVQKGYRDKY
jgi:hypothetical protein